VKLGSKNLIKSPKREIAGVFSGYISLTTIIFVRFHLFRPELLLFLLTPLALFGQLRNDLPPAEGTVTLGGAINPRARHEYDRGPVERERKLSHMTLVFKRSTEQRAALDRFLEELQAESSPNYHQWISPEEFGERFGASAENLQEAGDWLRSKGFMVESTARGRGWIVFSGTVAQVEGAFQTRIHRYQVGAKVHFAPALAPTIPARFEKFVSTIRGLDDFYLEPSKRPMPRYTGSDGTHALAPGDLAVIYDFQPYGEGQSIAVVGESDIDLADLRQFRSTFQLPANDPQLILAGDDPGTDASGLLEADSDLEWVGAVAPNANIEYAYATDVLVAAQYVIDQNVAPILTFSFYECEPNISAGDAMSIQDLAQQANAEGITWIAASGDAGAAACDPNTNVATNGLAVAFPASLPEVTAVGGTEFDESPSSWNTVNAPNLTSVFGYLPEVVWNDTSPALGLEASGGGASILFPKPPWQTGLGVPADGARDVPDLAFTASPNHDPYIVISGGQTYAAGGTSLSTPVFAGMLALIEQGGDGRTASPFGNINPGLYALASNSSATGIFHDIVSGNNFVPCAAGTQDCANGTLGYSAGPGYDLVTGLGSVNVSFLAYPLPLETITTLSVSATQVAQGTPVTLTATVQDYAGTVPQGSMTFGGFPSNNSATALSAAGTASLTVLLQAGTYSISAGLSVPEGSRFAGSVSAPVTVVVLPTPPSAPALSFPANGATGVSVSVELAWNTVSFATSYDLYIGTAPSPPYWGNVAGTQCYPGALAPNTTYYWAVAARNAFGSTRSPVWSFTTTSLVYTMSAIAGTSVPGFSPDGTPAVEALLSGPTDVALDGVGDLYVAESGNNRVRMINKAGILSTVAGGGSGGDGGPATSASLNSPMGLAFDRQGNLYISEYARVRMMSPAGFITTIAGGTAAGYSGDGGAAVNAQLSAPKGLAFDSKGNLYIADGCVREVSAGTISTFAGQCSLLGTGFTSGASVGDGGPATSANMDAWGVAVDAADNVYIADFGNCRVREVSNGIITSILGLPGGVQGCGGGGTPFAEFRPTRLTFDSSGVLYFIDGQINEYGEVAGGGVAKIVAGSPTVIAGEFELNVQGAGGPATSTIVIGPGGLTVDSAGNVYFTENYYDPYIPGVTYSQSVQKLTPSSNYRQPAPVITSGAVQNSASFAPPPVAPGSIATIYGSFGFGSPAQASGAPLPTALAGLSIQTQTGIDAPLFYASSGVVTIQVPWELAGQSSVSIRPFLTGNSGSTQPLLLAPFAPGIFTVNTNGQGAIVNATGQLVDSENPATAGDSIQIYCTGLGAVTNTPASGSAASLTTLSSTIATPKVTVGGVVAAITFSGLSPGTVGEYQINVQVPAGVPTGTAVPVVLSIGGVTSNTVTIAVR
jgi:uncharacterized protein (TIGR03437 family)